ncbi:NAD(P)-dependent oxidoreductase [Loktanella sp. IMCC34160]|uniref:NAD-dependent epimerase/dehydratase family protein n=1 Tax=Loktanella sp. IMCC34160 TaxID=2510646 RepID=UPI00101DA174|nr:NAD(P)-dependent oxidoreductase [Loktanella sp. IMCC34160]RYG89752.1 NAD(P)-dependent oxidoreductase [Loktanella sp. IMCC34160]
MRILFTGGSGKAGRQVIPYLLDQGHEVVNLDLQPLDIPGVPTLRVDLTDAGQVFNAMRAYGDFPDLEAGTGMPGFDAVVHFAAIARIMIVPDNETFRINTLSTYNVIDAALRMGVRKVIYASSETTYGVCFWDGHKQPDYIPVDEDHPTLPQDSYAMSKVCNEATARSFQARSGADIYGLRLNNVMEEDDYRTLFPQFIDNPDMRRRNFFAYIDGRDLGQMVDLCLKKDGLGHEVFNVANDDMSVGLTNAEVQARYYQGVPVKREMGEAEPMYSNAKAKAMLGFQPRHSWRDVLKG